MIGGKEDFAFRAGYFIFTCFLLADLCIFGSKTRFLPPVFLWFTTAFLVSKTRLVERILINEWKLIENRPAG